MGSAIELGHLLIDHALSVFSDIGVDAVDVDARAVLDWMRARGLAEVAQRELQNTMSSRFKRLDRLTAAMDRLIENGVARREKRRNGSTTPAVVYVFNPRALAVIDSLLSP
jgi:replicative DNA helicase